MQTDFLKNSLQRLQKLKKKRFFTYGLPFLILLVGGSFGVKYFASLRYEFRRSTLLKPENLEQYGIKKKKVTLEEEYEKIKQLDIDSWENIRGPRPWEEQQSKPTQ